LRRTHGRSYERGFSVLELVVVMGIMMVLAAMAVPGAVQMTRNFRLRNAGTEFAGLVQQARSRAVRDSNFYSMRIIYSTPITQAYVDIKKTSSLDTVNDPFVSWSPEVQPFAAGSAPDTSSLKTSAFLTSVGSTSVSVVDGFVTSGNGITFSPMGLPCVPSSSSSTAVCDHASSTTDTAFWVFFKNTKSGEWEAVTVTPAGRIQKWIHSGSKWSKL
jgi:Tfp pilus assembly protein FimT